jgi:hypothetical protein
VLVCLFAEFVFLVYGVCLFVCSWVWALLFLEFVLFCMFGSLCRFVCLFLCLCVCFFAVCGHSCGQDDVSHELSMPCIVHEFLEEAPRSILAKLVLASNTCDGGEPQVRSRRECRRMH